jgi:hypothetical protein
MLLKCETGLQANLAPHEFQAIEFARDVSTQHLFRHYDSRFPLERRLLPFHDFKHSILHVYAGIVLASVESICDQSMDTTEVVEACVSAALHEYDYDPISATLEGVNEARAAELVAEIMQQSGLEFFSKPGTIDRVAQNIRGTAFTLSFDSSDVLTAIVQKPKSERKSQLLICDADLGGIALSGEEYIARNIPICLEQNAMISAPEERIKIGRKFLEGNLNLIADHRFKTPKYRAKHEKNKASAIKAVEFVLANEDEINLLVN